MALLNDVVLPTCAARGLPALRNLAVENEICVPFVLDAPTSVRTLVHVVLYEESQDLQLWADLAVVSPPARPRLLELLNRLNSELRWLKFALVQQVVVMEVDLALGETRDQRGQFSGLLLAFLDALCTYWPEVLRTAARRTRRSRLDRELADLLIQPSNPRTDSEATT